MSSKSIQPLKIILFSFLIFLFSTDKVYAFVFATSNTQPILTTAKGKHTKHYKPGNFLRITYKSSDSKYEKINGRLINVTPDSIEILSKKSKPSLHIAITDIISVSKLHIPGREGWITAMSVLVLLTVLGIIFIDTVRVVIFLAVPVVALFTYVPFLFFSFMSDILSIKSISKGWRFYQQMK